MPSLASVAQLVGHRLVRETAGLISSSPSLFLSLFLSLKTNIFLKKDYTIFVLLTTLEGMDVEPWMRTSPLCPLTSHPSQHHGLLASVWSCQAPSHLPAFTPPRSSDALSLDVNMASPPLYSGFCRNVTFSEKKASFNPFPLSTLLPGLSSSVCPSRAGHTLVCFLSVTLTGWKLIDRRGQTVPSARCSAPAPMASPDTVRLYHLPVTLPHGAPLTRFRAQLLKPTRPLIKNEICEY